MADLRKFIDTLMQYLPMYLQHELKRDEIRRWLEKSLQETAAYGQEQRKTIEAGSKAQVLENIFNPEFFKGQNVPQMAILSHLAKTYPQLLPEGFQFPVDMEQQIADAAEALGQITKYQMAGEAPPDELLQRVSRFFGEKTLGEVAGDIIKQKEGAAERAVRGREAEIQEKTIPIRRAEVGLRGKELGTELGEMTAKEARATLADLGKERRGYQVKLGEVEQEIEDAKTEVENAKTEGIKNLKAFLYGEQVKKAAQLKSVIKEIKGQEDKINSMFSKEFDEEYQALAAEIKKRGGTARDLDTSEQLRASLIENGYNIEKLKKYFR